jgi:acyl-CoA thioesterase FadM
MRPEDERGPASIVVQRRIEWPDTDASGRWHNTAGFRFIEVAETALLERLGMLQDVYGRLPRVRIAADFKHGLSFRDVVDCEIQVRAVGTSSVRYFFELRSAGRVCMTAEVVAVLLGHDGHPDRWPDEHRAALTGAGPQPPEVLSVG